MGSAANDVSRRYRHGRQSGLSAQPPGATLSMDDRHWATSGLSAGQQFEHFCAKLLVRPLTGWGREAHEHLLVGFFSLRPCQLIEKGARNDQPLSGEFHQIAGTRKGKYTQTSICCKGWVATKSSRASSRCLSYLLRAARPMRHVGRPTSSLHRCIISPTPLVPHCTALHALHCKVCKALQRSSRTTKPIHW